MKARMKDTLLLIGDSTSDRLRLHDIFEHTFYLLEAESAAQGILLLQQNSSCIAAVLADIPLADGSELKALTKACHPGTENEIPVIALIVPTSTGEREELAFIYGAADVVLKPYTTLSIQKRVQVLVDLYSHRWHLEKLVQEQNETIRNTNQSMLDTLSAIIEHRNTESGNHVLRIRRFTQRLLQELMGSFPEYNLTEDTIDIISSAAVLHDIGKISVPDAILNKPGRLTQEEMDIMRTHTSVGSELVSQLHGMGDETYLRYIYNICLYHHERWDGSGYPTGLKGDEIPICAQVVGLADAFDALISPRVYKPAIPQTNAFNMILNGECGVFSPKLLECFKRARKDLFDLAALYADGYSPKSDIFQIPLPGPEQTDHPLNALQLSQLKYQALLHHSNDTVVELDLNNRIYHMVYNPNPEFLSTDHNASLDDFLDRLQNDSLHPEDLEALSGFQGLLYKQLFEENLRKHTFRCRLFYPLQGRYFPYEITVLRVNTENHNQKILLMIFHKEETEAASQPQTANPLASFRVLHDMINGILYCRSTYQLPIEQGIYTLYSLTGYSAEEIQQRFGSNLRQLVLPEDQPLLEALLRDPRLHSGTAEAELRLQSRSGKAVWVLCKARAQMDADGKEYIHLNLSDISRYKQQLFAMESTIHRNMVVLEQSESIVFEWDLEKNTVSFSDKWQKRFGYTGRTGALQLSDASGLFHPDDLPVLREKIQGLLQGNPTEVTDARMVNAEGRYLWSRIRASVLKGNDDRPAFLVGIIYDIDKLKTDALTSRQQAQQDSLTRLLNKASTQQAVSQYLESKKPDALGAMLILDLDNFKTVNDTHGHLYGDAILTQIGTTLRNLFRAGDVIGRIGGDEFLIFLKNVPSEEMVLDRCQLLIDTFRELLHNLMPDLDVSVSIGVSMVPAHGSSYGDLFQKADTALYSAKHKGKNQFALYSSQEVYSLLTAAPSRTRIDSDEQPDMNDDSLLRFVFRSLYDSKNLDATIDEVLSFVGAYFNVSRVYIFENNDDNTCCSNTFEWCNEGIAPEKENLQNVSYITDIPGWPDVYDERGILYCTDVTDLDPLVRRIIEPQGIKSMLHCAIMEQGVFRGYVGFDECNANRLWTQGQVETLEFLAQVLAVFLIKQRALDRLSR